MDIVKPRIETEPENWAGLRSIWIAVTQRRWLLIATVVAFVSAIMVYVFRLPPQYRATATSIVDMEAPQILGREVQEVVALGTSGAYFDPREYMLTQYRIVQSLALARRVVDALNLGAEPTFTANAPGQPASPLDPERAALKLQSMIQVEMLKDTRILRVSIEHWNPKTAAGLANAVTSEYINFNIDQKVSATSSAVGWLTKQIGEVQTKLNHAETDLHTFKQTNNIISVSLEDSQNLLLSQIKYLNDKLTETQTRRIALDARRKAYTTIRAQKDSIVSFPDLAEEAGLVQFKKAFDDERAKLTELKERYHAKHPAVEAQQAKTSEAEATLGRELDNRVRAVEAEYRMFVDTETNLRKALEEAKHAAITLNKKEVDFNRLKREQDNTGKVYSLLVSRLKESEISGQLKANNIRLLDRARVPDSPVRPRKVVSFILALMGGLGLGIVLVLLVERLDDSVKSPEALEQVTGSPLMGVFPRVAEESKDLIAAGGDEHRDPALHIHYAPKSGAAECFRSIRTNLLFASVTHPVRRILIASAVPREGKTTIAISLAVSLAQSGRRVVIVDADLRRPRVHESFGLSRERGLTNVLVGDAKVEDVLIQTIVERVSILACGPLPPNPAELLDSTGFSELMRRLGEMFDFVVVDSPPITAVADSLIASKNCDAAIVVARMRESSLSALRKASKHLRSIDVHVLGCILNDLDFDRKRYGTSYYYGYGYYSYSHASGSDEGVGKNGSRKSTKRASSSRPV
jgi:succinoglycan biosynthesis transport protein ExoP